MSTSWQQLHTHALVVAVDMDQPANDLVTIGTPEAVPVPTARIGYVRDGLEVIAGALPRELRDKLSYESLHTRPVMILPPELTAAG